MTEDEIKQITNNMDAEKLEKFVDDMLEKQNDLSTNVLNRLERIISREMDMHIMSRYIFKNRQEKLKQIIAQRRGLDTNVEIKKPKYKHDICTDQRKTDRMICRLVKDGLSLEQISKQVGCTINYVVCTKQEMKRNLHTESPVKRKLRRVVFSD